MTEVNEDKLDLLAKRLATEISPDSDLWPGVAAAIATPSRPRWMPVFAQAAAVVLLIGASSAVTYVAVKGQQVPVVQVSPELIFEQAAFGNHNLGPGFQDARSALVAEFDVELARLSPEARDEVEKSLGIVREAIVDISDALGQDPDNVLLQERLLRAYRDELSLLRRVGGLTRNIMIRNDI